MRAKAAIPSAAPVADEVLFGLSLGRKLDKTLGLCELLLFGRVGQILLLLLKAKTTIGHGSERHERKASLQPRWLAKGALSV
jgi:hypothetical protein